MTRILVPYRFAEPLLKLGDLLTPDAAIVVARGEPQETAGRIHEQLAARVAASDAPVLVAGGDAVIGSAVIAGLQRRGLEPSVLWCSAFPALHTPRTTTPASRGLDGTALAIVLGWTGTVLTSRSGQRPIDAPNVLLVDGRAAGDEARAIAARDRIGWCEVAGLADAVPPPPWSVHLDLDLFDPDAVGPLRNPIPGGPSIADVATAFAAVRERGEIVALTVAISLTARGLEAPDTRDRVRSAIAAVSGAA